MNETLHDIWVSPGVSDLSGKPALFLDRDGVVVEEVNYLHRTQDVSLVAGIDSVIRDARNANAAVIVVTNQSGLARGLFDWIDYHAVESEITKRLAELGSHIDATIACPFHPNFTPSYDERHAYWRKPGPGMIKLAATRFGLDLRSSILIGDNASDIEAARAASLPQAIHLLTGHGPSYRQEALALTRSDFDVWACDSPTDAREILAKRWAPKIT